MRRLRLAPIALVLLAGTTSCGFALRVEAVSAPPPTVEPPRSGGPAVIVPPGAGSGSSARPNVQTGAMPGLMPMLAPPASPLPTVEDLTSQTPPTSTCAHLDATITYGEAAISGAGDDQLLFLDEAIAALHRLAGELEGTERADALRDAIRSWSDALVDRRAQPADLRPLRDDLVPFLEDRGGPVLTLIGRAAEGCGLDVGEDPDLVKLVADAMEQREAS